MIFEKDKKQKRNKNFFGKKLIRLVQDRQKNPPVSNEKCYRILWRKYYSPNGTSLKMPKHHKMNFNSVIECVQLLSNYTVDNHGRRWFFFE